jgi:hypothetical protein
MKMARKIIVVTIILVFGLGWFLVKNKSDSQALKPPIDQGKAAAKIPENLARIHAATLPERTPLVFNNATPTDVKWYGAQRADDLMAAFSEIKKSNDVNEFALVGHVVALCGYAGYLQRMGSGKGVGLEKHLASDVVLKPIVIKNILSVTTMTVHRCGAAAEVNNSDLFGFDAAHMVTHGKFSPLRISSPFGAKTFSDGVTTDEFNAITTVIADPYLASIWMVNNISLVKLAAQQQNLVKDLSAEEVVAMSWLVACDMGADCTGTGLGRAKACISDYICGESTVADGVITSFGLERFSIIRERANNLGFILNQQGASAFNFKRK